MTISDTDLINWFDRQPLWKQTEILHDTRNGDTFRGKVIHYYALAHRKDYFAFYQIVERL